MHPHNNRHKVGADQVELSFLIEKNADGILVVDQEGAVLFANPAAEQIFGRSSEQLIGTAVGIPAVDGETTEIMVLRPGGERVEAEIRIVETTWEDRPAWLASLRDISARRLVEERLRHAAKMEAVGRLTAGIAHDFNNLLTVIIGSLESIQRHSDTAGPRIKTAAQNAMTGARRAATLTQRLLAFARRQPLDPQSMNVNELVSGMSDLFSRTLGESIAVEVKLDDTIGFAYADPTELEAALLNLAVNARDAMPNGGKLLIETASVRFDETEAVAYGIQTGAHVLIAVTDTGSGMSKEVLDQAIEPFFTTKEAGHGTGLGLSQVYGFVKQSGGHVHIDSKLGVGTSVKLYLPSHREAPEEGGAKSAPTAAVPTGMSSETLLVVEDNEDVRRYTTTSLRELGYRVLEAADAASALQILRGEPDVRLLLTDLGLPGGMDGRELAKQANRLCPALKVLLTSAYVGNSLQDGNLDRDIAFLAKPFSFTDLGFKIRNLLNEKAIAKSVLVVEDEALIRIVLVEALTDAGFHVEEAGSRQEAMRLLETAGKEFKAVVLDVGLPDGPGDELLEPIRAKWPGMPVILATGHASSGVRPHSSDDARVKEIGKPFHPDELIAILKEWDVGP